MCRVCVAITAFAVSAVANVVLDGVNHTCDVMGTTVDAKDRREGRLWPDEPMWDGDEAPIVVEDDVDSAA
jgi:hypothetical protein